jgi:hypothetical protein
MKIPQDMIPGTKHQTKSSGEIEILDYINSSDVKIKFIATGAVASVYSGNIRLGSIKDPLKPVVLGVGYFGIGEFKAKVNGSNTPAYERWRGMLKRCYCDKYQKRFPTYTGCLVASEWHNFQVFAKWFYENYPNDGVNYDLDKDIVQDGNKIYSSEFCKFVTKKENYAKAHAKAHYFKKNGKVLKIVNLRDFCNGDESLRKRLVALKAGKVLPFDGWERAKESDLELLDREEDATNCPIL